MNLCAYVYICLCACVCVIILCVRMHALECI